VPRSPGSRKEPRADLRVFGGLEAGSRDQLIHDAACCTERSKAFLHFWIIRKEQLVLLRNPRRQKAKRSQKGKAAENIRSWQRRSNNDGGSGRYAINGGRCEGNSQDSEGILYEYRVIGRGGGNPPVVHVDDHDDIVCPRSGASRSSESISHAAAVVSSDAVTSRPSNSESWRKLHCASRRPAMGAASSTLAF
jgi:hypothetical protein